MRNTKDKWAFHALPGREALSAADVMYWRRTLAKILKVGMEFEFNLPEKKNGTCKGDSNSCPCARMTDANDCWKKCINETVCKKTNCDTRFCKNVTQKCKDSMCSACDKFELLCNGLLCPNFASKCLFCDEYVIECKDCQFMYDPARNPDNIRDLLTNKFAPNNTYGQVNKSGVHSITTDGSLLGKKGMEVITIGRRVDYWEFHKMARHIIEESVNKGAYMNERCSIHMHALASYYGKTTPAPTESMSIPSKVTELERDMPEIILANLHQLVRRYQNAMTWMLMGLDDPEHLTRWEKFRVSILPISAVMHHMRDVRQEVSNISGGTKYGWINYNQIGFGNDGGINRFHVEFRAADGLLSPSAVAAIGCMYYALIIKAVEISRFGLVEIGDKAWMSKAQEVKEAILNGMGDYKGSRFGDTSSLHRYYDTLIEESMDLVRQLKAILIKIGPAYEVLEKLAERPCALRLVDGHSWERIEADLQVKIDNEDKIDMLLNEVVTLNQICECDTEEEWIKAVGILLKESSAVSEEVTEDRIRTYMEKRKEEGELIWSNKIGAPILI